MPKHEGVFIPHPHCTVASGGCFEHGRCMRACSAHKKCTLEQQIKSLEARVLWLERAVCTKETKNGN